MQLCNLIGDWLADLEGSRATVDECFESALSALIVKHFQPELADKIFEAEGVGIEWLPELISHKPWRRLIYSLAEQYPHCLMLNFAVKLISDAGFQHEISNVNTAAQQLEIFSRVVLFTIDAVFHEHRRGPMTEAYENALAELVRVVCHSEHTYLYTQALLHVICEEVLFDLINIFALCWACLYYQYIQRIHIFVSVSWKSMVLLNGQDLVR
ncbi:unnamed protein product [Brugia timori]|uniref:Exportin-1/Importin-beta-like domain-containing protein n=1 Tax=Brugia timori TaxID=42155 RepID=A0A0R3QDX8_9BILA|nr:unnamed protein product [Brugia timori]